MKTQLKELLVLHFLNDGVRTTLIVLLPLVARDLSLSLSLVGFLGSSQPMLATILALPTGYFVGKLGGFKIIFIILLLYSLSTLGIAFASDTPSVLILYFLAAMGFGMFHTVGFTLTAKMSKTGTVGRNMGDFTSIGEIGRVAIPPIAIFSAAAIGWRLTFAILGSLGCFVFLASLFLPKTKEAFKLNAENSNNQTQKDFLKDIFYLIKNKKALYITLGALIDSLASSPIYVYLPFLLVMKGMTPAELGIAMAAFFVGSLGGKSFLGRGVDKFGNAKVFIFSEIFMAACLVLAVLSESFLLLLFFSTLLGVFTKGTSPVVQTMFSELTDKDHYHKIYAFSELSIGSAAVITVVVLGFLAEKSDISVVFYISAFLALIAIVPIYSLQRLSMSTKLH